MSFEFKTRIKKRLADTETPVSIYLKVRDHFSESILFECSENESNSNRYSYICFQPIAGIIVTSSTIKTKYPDGEIQIRQIDHTTDVIIEITRFTEQFSIGTNNELNTNGIWGHINFEAVQYFENIEFTARPDPDKQIPDIRFSLYRFTIIFDHHNTELQIIELHSDDEQESKIQAIETLVGKPNSTAFSFKTTSEEYSDHTDESFVKTVTQGKEHCMRGDVFQIVLSREFSIDYQGDDFNVYRSLRSINASPYMFYFDYGSYRIFGASPEAQLNITNGKASLHPIAGTYRRTGNAQADISLANKLKEDKKENAEHTMLVDLARNDLSKHYRNVDVPIYKTIQLFSHVLHIVSKVVGENAIENVHPMKIAADTFPAGTLSGAPKYKALQLIDKYEHSSRGFYGGCIGYLGFNGNFNHAILIRSFLSKNNTLYYRAGAGVVASSVEENELQEVTNKLAASRKALKIANTL